MAIWDEKHSIFGCGLRVQPIDQKVKVKLVKSVTTQCWKILMVKTLCHFSVMCQVLLL